MERIPDKVIDMLSGDSEMKDLAASIANIDREDITDEPTYTNTYNMRDLEPSLREIPLVFKYLDIL